jgi:hypothetical protein
VLEDMELVVDDPGLRGVALLDFSSTVAPRFLT